MTNAEFKAWFDGFSENLEGTPNEKQWAKIKEKIKAIDGTPTTYPVFVDRYLPRFPLQPWYESVWCSNGIDKGNVGLTVRSDGMTAGSEDGPIIKDQFLTECEAIIGDSEKQPVAKNEWPNGWGADAIRKQLDVIEAKYNEPIRKAMHVQANEFLEKAGYDANGKPEPWRTDPWNHEVPVGEVVGMSFRQREKNGGTIPEYATWVFEDYLPGVAGYLYRRTS